MSITLSDSLVKRIQALRESKGENTLNLRVQVDGGGCQGFEYKFELTAGVTNDDEIFEKDGVKVIIDSLSLPYLDGSEIHYTDDMVGAHFSVRNPNATSSCGCGTSFSL